MPRQDNLAHTTYVSVSPLPKPGKQIAPSPVHTPNPSSTKRQLGFTRLEKTVLTLFSLLFFGLFVLNISEAIHVNSINQAKQDIVQQTTDMSYLNTNLEQQVQELSRYDRIYSIAQRFGLIENEDNVRNVSK